MLENFPFVPPLKKKKKAATGLDFGKLYARSAHTDLLEIQDAPVEHVVRRNPWETTQVRCDACTFLLLGHRAVLSRLSGPLHVLLTNCEMPKPGLGRDSAFHTGQYQILVRHRK